MSGDHVVDSTLCCADAQWMSCFGVTRVEIGPTKTIVRFRVADGTAQIATGPEYPVDAMERTIAREQSNARQRVRQLSEEKTR